MHTSRAVLPPPVVPGDRVGVAALSGPVDPERLERGLAALAGLGFEAVPAANLGEQSGLFAGDDRRRLDAFHRLAADPSLKAIFFARGGHGVTRVLPEIDWDLLAAHPRAYIGYSDLTPFLLEVVGRLGLVAFHGPMVAADLARGLSGEEAASLLAALAGAYPRAYRLGGVVDRAGGNGSAGPAAEPISGPLLGGCLSLLVSVLGTPHRPELSDALLFWEDVGEPLYRIDRMLTHLRLSGSLAGIRAMVVGHAEPTDAAGEPPAAWLSDALAGFSLPLAWGLAAGHRAPNLTLPLGLTSRLEPAASRLVCGEG
jgi:muramoyltetrapeptide carboxypeptidase